MHKAFVLCPGSLARLLVVLLAIASLMGCGGGEPKKRIVFLINTPDPYWEANEAGLKAGARQFNLDAAGLTVVQDPNDGTPQGQISKLRLYGTQRDIVAVAISPLQRDNETIVAEMRKLQQKGIKVITVDNDVDREQFRDARSYYIGTDNFVAGKALGTAVKAVLEEKGVSSGSYAQFVGITDADNARARMDGVTEAMGADYREADRAADQTERQRARDTVRTALTNHKDLVALFGIWAYNAPAIVDVVKERKVRDKLVIGTFDAQKQAVDHMDDGKIDVMVVQNPYDMGVQTVRLLKAMIEDDQATIDGMFPARDATDGDIYTTGVRVVVPPDSPVKAELFDPNVVEFMPLEEFKAWLKERNLTDS
jgi:ribose transport system substrate-binding protein